MKKAVKAVPSLVGLGIGLVLVVLMLTGTLDLLEWRIDDILTRWSADPTAASDEVAVILLDQKSLDWAEEEMGLVWPWPRELYAVLTDFVAGGNARALGFDVIFSEASFYNSGDQPYDDLAYAESLAAFSRGVGTVFLSNRDGVTAWPEEMPRPPESSDSAGLPSAGYAQFPIPVIGSSYAELANVQVPADSDGVFRRVPPGMAFDGLAVPSMALALYRTGGAGAGELEQRGARLYLDGRRLPVDRDGNLTLRYRGPSGSHPTYSAAEVINSQIQIYSGQTPQLDPSVFDGKYVLFGFSAPGLKDLRPSPVSETYAGVEIHLTMLDNLLSENSFILPVIDMGIGWAVLVSLILLFLSTTAAAAVSSAHGYRNSILVFLAFVALSLVLTAPFYFIGINLPVLPFFAAVAFALTASFIVNYATEGRKARMITGIFSEFMNDEYVNILIENGEMPRLGGEKKNLTIFFSDLQGFTTISEGLDPEELTSLLNVYLTAMSDIIMEEGGTIDKYEGDAIIAFWNAPLDLEGHAVRGIRAALRCQEVLESMQDELRALSKGLPLLMRIGMNTGEAVVGNMGSENHKNYTMFGDAVNLAARLEGVNKQFGTYTMISQMTLDSARAQGQDFPVRELARVEVVGKSEPVTVYEPMTPEAWNRGKDIWEDFSRTLEHFYAGRFAEARSGFLALSDRDPASAKYLAKLQSMGDRPPVGWSGVWVMTSK